MEDFDLFQSFAVATRRKLGLPTSKSSASRSAIRFEPPVEIAFPEPAYSAAAHVNRIFSTDVFRYSYQSLVSPPSVYEYNVARADSAFPIGQSRLLKQQQVPGGFNPARYASERLWITASDGIKVPVSIVYRRDRFRRIAINPLYVYGYGSYGYPLPVGFSPTRLSLLDRGVVMAYAHIRGGGEMGDAWHDAGKMSRQEQHLHRLHLRRRAARRARLRQPQQNRHRRRQRRRTPDGRGRQHAPRTSSASSCRMSPSST